jgi:hypothetical protein
MHAMQCLQRRPFDSDFPEAETTKTVANTLLEKADNKYAVNEF